MKTALKALTPLLAILLLTCGCSFYNDEEQAEYDRTWATSREVLAKYFNVKESQFIEGHLIAYSRISNQFGEMQRYKVDTWIDRDVEGFFHPHVQVVNQMNMAVVDPAENTRGQVNPAWRNTGFNHKLATQLLNEIHDRLGYHTGSVDADWFNTDLELIERQRKIDAARESYRMSEGASSQPMSAGAGAAMPADPTVPTGGAVRSHSTSRGQY